MAEAAETASAAGAPPGGSEMVMALGAAGSVARAADFRYSMEYLPHGHRYTPAAFRIMQPAIGCGKFGTSGGTATD